MAATDPPSDHGNDSSIDLQFEKDEEVCYDYIKFLKNGFCLSIQSLHHRL